jgi:hypothetical protein
MIYFLPANDGKGLVKKSETYEVIEIDEIMKTFDGIRGKIEALSPSKKRKEDLSWMQEKINP